MNEPKENTQRSPYDHLAPVRHLVKQVLHKGRDLRANVVRLRYKRRRVKVPEMEVGV